MKGKRARFADPRPDNVTIPAPPGHRRSLHYFGAAHDHLMIQCECGWRSLVLPVQQAEETYDKHLDASGDWCDFCGGVWPIAKDYDCETFSVDFATVSGTGMPELFVYQDGWLACGACSKLVDAGKWGELAARSVEMTFKATRPPGTDVEYALMVYRSTPTYRVALDRIGFLHQAFQAHRKTETS